MKNNRIKVTLPTIATRDEAETVMNELALAVNNQRKLAAQRDAMILTINQRYESPFAEVDQAIKAKTDALRVWAETNPDQFPKGRKSVEMVSGILGFRTGTPKLALLTRAFNWDKVLKLLRAVSPWRNYIRTKEEVDKEAILGNYSQTPDKPSMDMDLRRFGLKVTQDETFYVEPKLAEIETRQTAPAES